MQRLLTLTFFLTFTLNGCQRSHRVRDQTMTLVSAQPLAVGEAVSCPSIDMKQMEVRCFSLPEQRLTMRKYLVKVTFDKPLSTDRNGWAYDVTCHLDSYQSATCHQNRVRK